MAAEIKNKHLDCFILGKIPVKMIDCSGNSSVVVILYRYRDHGSRCIKFQHGNHEGVMKLSDVASIEARDQ